MTKSFSENDRWPRLLLMYCVERKNNPLVTFCHTTRMPHAAERQCRARHGQVSGSRDWVVGQPPAGFDSTAIPGFFAVGGQPRASTGHSGACGGCNEPHACIQPNKTRYLAITITLPERVHIHPRYDQYLRRLPPQTGRAEHIH